MKKLGFVGYRGMVGSVLLTRLAEDKMSDDFDYSFYSQSNNGSLLTVFNTSFTVKDSSSLEELLSEDIIVSCQGAEYTNDIHPNLRSMGWNGFWIDASSALRNNDNTLLVLDPLNRESIDRALEGGVRDFSGANCTVSLLLLALDGLYKENLIEWVSSMTYQAISGAGASAITNLYSDYDLCSELKSSNPLEKEQQIKNLFLEDKIDMGYNIQPWIDADNNSGSSKEELKAKTEASKIMNRDILIDGTCARVSSLRCHSQALTIKLNKDISLKSLESVIQENSNQWIKYTPNDKTNTLRYLSPHNVSNSLDIAVGRMKKMNFGNNYLNLYTIGDQLLWGAAEPLKRMLKILSHI
jgi:aspartate-semialdehyde dehydrogenase